MTTRWLAGLAALVLLQAPATNLVKNGSFDRDLSGWDVIPKIGPSGAFWMPPTPDGSAAVRVLNAARDRMHTGKDNVDVLIDQCVPVKAATHYRLVARARGPRDQHVNGIGAVQILWFEAADCHLRGKTGGLGPGAPRATLTDIDGVWHDLSLPDLVVPARVRAASISLDVIVIDDDHQHDFEVWFDDVVLVVKR